jgi:transcription elongation factor Elf1
MSDLRPVRTIQSVAEELTPAQKIKVMQRARAMKEGRLPTPPFRCGHCNSQSLTKELADPKRPEGEDDNLRICLACGRRTKVVTLRRQRQLDIQAIIMADLS